MTPIAPRAAARAAAGRGLAGALALAGALLVSSGASAGASSAERACPGPGQWVDPASGELREPDAVLEALAGHDVVLLGESHSNAEDHRWQAAVLAALHGRRPAMAVGFEMFPRRLQGVLDRWAAGELTEAGFLEQSQWQRVWGFDPGLYLPLFHFVRQQRLPMVALNVERALVARVGDEGWAAVPEAEREGLTDPAPASEAYRRSLAEVYREKHRRRAAAESRSQEPPTLEEILESEDFQRFVEAQLTWDRGMAEALAEAKRSRPEALVVGIVGRGHAERGHGIPHQLAALGLTEVAVALPLAPEALCDGEQSDLADAVFLVDPTMQRPPEAPRPRLGVMIGPGDGGVVVSEVIAGSVAEAAGLAAGDLIVEAAGFAVALVEDLIEIVRRQAPGTWLPLGVERDGESLEIVARFPQRFGEDE